MELIALGAMMRMAELTASHLVSALARLDLPSTLLLLLFVDFPLLTH